MCKSIPSNAAVSSNSSAWAALLFQSGRSSIGGMMVGSNAANEPLELLPAGASHYSVTLDCNKTSYATFQCTRNKNPNNSPQTIPTNTYVEPAGDHHSSHDDVSKQGEFDYYDADDPAPTSGTWHVGGAGFCPWSGDGTGCSGSTATDIATSLGGVDENDLTAAEADPVHGVLPYALGVTVLCADPSFVYPATASDGSNTNSTSACAGHLGSGQRPPEGTRWYIAMTDAQIDATNNAPYVKALLRTMDEQHYGGVIVDTNWAEGPGFQVLYRHQSYLKAAGEAGISGNGQYTVPITTNGIDLQSQVYFCSNGTC